MLPSKFKKPYVSLIDSDFDEIVYRIHCGCMESNHDVYVEFRFDKDNGIISLLFSNDMVWTDDYYNKWYEWPKKIWERFKVAVKVFFTGHINKAGDVLMYNEEHVETVIEMLKEGLENMRKVRKDKNETIGV